MSIRSEINQKLDYVDQKHQELAEGFFTEGFSEKPLEFIESLVADIIGTARETFDYCARDIVETHIAPYDTDVATKLKADKIRCYYPFYKSQLTKKSTVFFKLKHTNPKLHSYLFSIAAAIESKKLYPGTTHNFCGLSEMADMVNCKKHHKLLVVSTNQKGSVFVENNGTKMIIPIAQQKGIGSVTFGKGAVHTMGNNYVLESNQKDALHFTMFCTKFTRILMNKIYEEYFS